MFIRLATDDDVQQRDWRVAVVRLVRAAGILAVVAYAAHSTFGFGSDSPTGPFEGWIYNGVFVAGAALALLRALTVRTGRSTWAVLGTGLAFWAAGTILYTVDPGNLTDGPFPSASDLMWLVFYPAGFVTLVLLVRARARVFYGSLWLDGVVGALALSALAAQFVLPPIVALTGAPGEDVVADLIYPAGDLLLMVFVVCVLALTGWRPGRQLALVSAGFALGAVADSWSLYWSATGHSSATPMDALWPACALLLGCAAWTGGERPDSMDLVGRRLLVLPVAFAGVALCLLGLNGVEPIHRIAYALAVLTLAGAVARMANTFVENVRLAASSRNEALTDSLTGLANRRKLMMDLPVALAEATPERGHMLVLFDLNGFKGYNDTFGHPAGDVLLAKLGMRLEAAVAEHGTAYRLGGDEFCVLYDAGAATSDVSVAAARAALSDRGEGVQVTASYGVVHLPNEARDVAAALQVADDRMYAHKRSLRGSAPGRDRVDYAAVQVHVPEPVDQEVRSS